jgi:2'-5' RNA ligase
VRLFVAINLPADERQALHAATVALRSDGLPVKWVDSEKLHVTIRFLGSVDDAMAGPIGDALAGAVAGHKPFDVTLGGAGAFPDTQHPRVLWIGVEKHPALELLAHDVARVLGGFGFPPELRPFQPHVTIGRARDDAPAGGMQAATAGLEGLDYAGVMPVASVDLMESAAGRYRAVRRASLGGGA